MMWEKRGLVNLDWLILRLTGIWHRIEALEWNPPAISLLGAQITVMSKPVIQTALSRHINTLPGFPKVDV